ncbi:Ig-like domain-containing protein [Treponema zioleckii]|uniref:Ig-like domain-containing protein n=1 Tax=Treponema zioleckii TaxID=331680 RepID=UPI00168BBD69|nr:Ig-like domain-containing protein [Treponema zioleckii]
MKKLSKTFLILASSLFVAANGFFVSCSDDAGDDVSPVTNTPKPLPDDENNSQPEPIIGDSFKLSDLDDYYKKYFVKSGEAGPEIADWGAGSEAKRNENNTWTIKSSDSMWTGVGGIAAAFTGLEEGALSGYEYIVFTADISNFTINTEKNEGNYGVNIQIPKVQKAVTDNFVMNADGTRTYYAKISDFGSAPETAVEFALIAGGSGTFGLKELYFAAKENPAEKAVTKITISASAEKLEQGEKIQFTVKDSNSKNITENVTYTLSGDAAQGSSIDKSGFLTAGNKAGSLTVKASYTVDEKTFETEMTVTVLGTLQNLISKIELEKYTDASGAGNSAVSIEDGIVSVSKPAASGWGAWSSQLFLTISSDSTPIFNAGKKYFISATLESDSDLNGCIWKGGDNEGYLLQEKIELKSGEAVTLVKEIEFTATFDKFQCIFAFGETGAANIKISNFKIYDITE